jgi:hypothetical protein
VFKGRRAKRARPLTRALEHMKNPKPAPPSDVSPGTVWFGGAIGWFSLSLHVRADDLHPDAVSALFKVQPTEVQSKGVPLLRPDGTLRRVPKFGSWTLQVKSDETDEWDIEDVIRSLLSRLPSLVGTWRDVGSHGSIHLSVGLSLSTSNQGFSLAPDLLAFLGERNAGISFDVYDKEF